ncbi:hypothetical protein ALC57_16658 [Trachymyrmex cornetzi]|uniref:GIY-YIG domain-containing protein n=1 Tax=Trachymyrmex cornetzi TaxID=471704 RepID=A0A151IUM0_9HYME|nr:hypothetical protein ALC57_16658 [Trachymyrmex cornetzi]
MGNTSNKIFFILFSCNKRVFSIKKLRFHIYIPGKDITKNLNVSMAFFSLNKLNCFIKTHKDPLPNMAKKHIVYKINCNNCDASYVGQTKRKLKTRITEHRNDIRKSNNNYSVVTRYRLEHGHDFDLENIEIVDSERYIDDVFLKCYT